MKILDRKDEKILLGKLTMSRHRDEEQGFLLEVNENEVPKKIRESLKVALGGSGSTTVVDRRYFLSNTSGEICHKFFKQVANRIKFHLKNDNILEELNGETDFIKGIDLITEALDRNRDSLKFIFDYWIKNYYQEENSRERNHINCKLRLEIYEDDFINYPHIFENDPNFEKYKKFFKGRDTAIITFDFDFPIEYKCEHHEGLEKLKELFKNENYTIADIEKNIKGSDNHKWYFSTDQNTTFYGNDKD